MDYETLTRLWHEYRDAERAAWAEDYLVGWDRMRRCRATWDDYKGMFKRFPNFPDWLRDGGHLQQAEEEAENRRSILDALESAPHLSWDIAQVSAKALVPPGLTQVILGELEEEGRVKMEAGLGRARWRARSGEKE